MGLRGIAGAFTGIATPNSLATFRNQPALLLPKWRLALSKVRSNNADARMLWVGDSTFSGLGSTGAPQQSTTSVVARTRQLLNSAINPFVNGLVIPNVSGGNDTRIALTGQWNLNTSFGSAGKCCLQAVSGATGNAVFTPGINCDGFYVYYLSYPGAGTFHATGTGGSPVTINAGAAANTIRSALVSCASASTSNTCTLDTVATNSAFVVGIEPVLSTTKQVLVGNIGVSGATTANWNTGAQSGTGIIAANAPDLTVISLGINDAVNSVSNSTLQTNLQALITTAQLTGDVLLSDMPPSNVSNNALYANEAGYIGVYQALAAANNCAYVSEYGRLNSTFQTTYMNDAAHPNDYGYWDWAQAISSYLTSF